MAFHVGGGIGIPYGNSDILPFEKRHYSGGANSVRVVGKNARSRVVITGNNSVSEFINQCGDIRLDINFEYRTKLFWKVELGLLSMFAIFGRSGITNRSLAVSSDWICFIRKSLAYGLGNPSGFSAILLLGFDME
ncbi:MAG: hypothetical protein ACLU18_16300 [Bacteroides thetaiotaomicron]